MITEIKISEELPKKLVFVNTDKGILCINSKDEWVDEMLIPVKELPTYWIKPKNYNV